MKKPILFCLVLVVATSFAQTTVNPNNNNLNALATYGPDGANIGSSSIVINPPKKINGSVHLFPSWENTAVFVMGGSENKFLLKNINYNIERSAFESKIGRDSLFTFNFDNIERIIVNGRKFENKYLATERGNTIFEVLFDDGNVALLKRHFLVIKEGSDNPMVVRPSKYVQKASYYVKKGTYIKPFAFKKKNILTLLKGKNKAIDAYAKENQLSFKKEADVIKMLNGVSLN